MESMIVSAAQGYASSRPATQPGTGSGNSMFGQLAADFAERLAQSETISQRAWMAR